MAQDKAIIPRDVLIKKATGNEKPTEEEAVQASFRAGIELAKGNKDIAILLYTFSEQITQEEATTQIDALLAEYTAKKMRGEV